MSKRRTIAEAKCGVQVAATVGSMSTDRPALVELLVGPFRGLGVYPRAARLGTGRAIGLLALVILVLAMVVGGIWMVRLQSKVATMADSAIWFMPRVNVRGGVAQVEADPGRVIETDRVVILFDTVSAEPVIPKAFGEDDRPRVLVRERAMLLFTKERPVPTALPWAQVNEALGPVSVDGPELIDALRSFVPRMVVTLGAIGALAVFLWQLVLAAVFVGLYRTLFGRGLYVPGAGALMGVASTAALPPLLAGAVLLGLGRQELALAVQGVGFGALFLLGATRVRLGDERPDAKAPSDAPSEGPSEASPEMTPKAKRPVATEL